MITDNAIKENLSDELKTFCNRLRECGYREMTIDEDVSRGWGERKNK